MLITAEHASARFGGEAILPLHLFRGLRKRGIDVWMVVHDRTRAELQDLLGKDIERVEFIPDTRVHRFLAWISHHMAAGALRNFTVDQLGRLWTQVLSKRLARRMIERHKIEVLHQPTPVSPKEFSLMSGLRVPVVMGPMNGNMIYPPAFAAMQSRRNRAFVQVGRSLSSWPNRLFPGKLRAAALLVANDRTAAGLPRGVRGRVVKLVENGVHPSQWQPHERAAGDPTVRFGFVGRFETWKGIDLLLEAFGTVVQQTRATLDIIGDGPPRGQYEELARRLGVSDRVSFLGWLPQEKVAEQFRRMDIFVLPSLFECGGAVVLEAMAAGVPVIASRWGGPVDYLNDSCGVLVDPVDKPQFIAALSTAMIELAHDEPRRGALARAARARVLEEFGWDKKIDRILDVYSEVIGRP